MVKDSGPAIKPRSPSVLDVELGGRDRSLSFVSKKEGGANSAGDFGGVYEDDMDVASRKMLLKHDAAEKDMAEFLASRIFEVTVPDHSARVDLVTVREASGEKHNYIASRFLDDYKDLSREVVDRYAPRKGGRTFAAGTVDRITGFLRVGMLGRDGTPKYDGFAQTMATSLLVGDFDVHTGNVGVVGRGAGRKKLVRIDYAAAFANLEAEIHPHSRSRHLAGMGPTNHFREYPHSMRISPEMAAECMRVSAIDVSGAVNRAFDEIAMSYSAGDLKKFALRMGIKEEMPVSHSALVDMIKSKTSATLKQRQESLKEFGIEIALTLCFDKNGKFVEGGKEKLQELVDNNKEYFRKIDSKEKPLHLRHEYNVLDYLNVSKLFAERTDSIILRHIKTSLAHEREASHVPDARGDRVALIRNALTRSAPVVEPPVRTVVNPFHHK